MRVCCVIVTYGERFHLLKEVIEACFQEGAHKVVVVDNDSSHSSKRKLQEYATRFKKLEVLFLDRNTGSAGGYKMGLKKAYGDRECEYIWLLDDDNKPLAGALDRLKEFYAKLNIPKKKERVALLANRIDKQIIEKKLYKAPMKNSFLGFEIVHRLKRKTKETKERIEVAPYGGLFFHKELLPKIGYPREEFFVYVDDYEWSYKIPAIYFVRESRVEDLERRNIADKSGVKHYFDKSDVVLYYGVRNRVIWEREKFVTNRWLYNLNKMVYLAILVGTNPLHPKLKLFFKAIQDAKK